MTSGFLSRIVKCAGLAGVKSDGLLAEKSGVMAILIQLPANPTTCRNSV